MVCRAVVGHQKFRHIEPDPARPDDGDLVADRGRAAQHVDIGHHIGAILPRDRRIARQHACCNHDLVETGQIIRRRDTAQRQCNTCLGDHRVVVIDKAPELLFAGDLFGKVQLPADPV